MQELLHAILIHERQECVGLLVKTGNIVEAQLNVTQKLLSSVRNSVSFIKEQEQSAARRHINICGIYHSASVSQSTIDQLITAYQTALGESPDFYLRLDPDQPGRIDALLFRDAGHNQSIELNMVEECSA
ncbi:MAG: hypothetical protein R8K50_01075 [Mariprofundus sp.]